MTRFGSRLSKCVTRSRALPGEPLGIERRGERRPHFALAERVLVVGAEHADLAQRCAGAEDVGGNEAASEPVRAGRFR
jgi:hypothetical protein